VWKETAWNSSSRITWQDNVRLLRTDAHRKPSQQPRGETRHKNRGRKAAAHLERRAARPVVLELRGRGQRSVPRGVWPGQYPAMHRLTHRLRAQKGGRLEVWWRKEASQDLALSWLLKRIRILRSLDSVSEYCARSTPYQNLALARLRIRILRLLTSGSEFGARSNPPGSVKPLHTSRTCRGSQRRRATRPLSEALSARVGRGGRAASTSTARSQRSSPKPAAQTPSPSPPASSRPAPPRAAPPGSSTPEESIFYIENSLYIDPSPHPVVSFSSGRPGAPHAAAGPGG